MTGYEFCGGYWWIFPLVMIICCFFIMRKSCCKRMCGFGSNTCLEESALHILNRQYAKGEINLKEYEEKKRALEMLNK